MRTLTIICLALIAATCFIAIKAGLNYAPPLAFAGLRLLLAGLTLLTLTLAVHHSLVPARRLWPWIVFLALTASAGTYGAMFLSPGRAGAGVASVLGNLQPVFVVGLAALVLGERMRRGDWVTLILGALGAIFIALPNVYDGPVAGISGPFLALMASLGFALGSVIVKRIQPGSDLLVVTGWQLVGGSLPLLAAAALVEHDTPFRWTIAFVALLLFLGLVGTALTTVVWYWLVQHGDIGRMSVLFFLVPVFGLGSAIAIYGESTSWLGAAGVVLVVLALAVAWCESRREADSNASAEAGLPPSREAPRRMRPLRFTARERPTPTDWT